MKAAKDDKQTTKMQHMRKTFRDAGRISSKSLTLQRPEIGVACSFVGFSFDIIKNSKNNGEKIEYFH